MSVCQCVRASQDPAFVSANHSGADEACAAESHPEQGRDRRAAGDVGGWDETKPLGAFLRSNIQDLYKAFIYNLVSHHIDLTHSLNCQQSLGRPPAFHSLISLS